MWFVNSSITEDKPPVAEQPHGKDFMEALLLGRVRIWEQLHYCVVT